MLPRFEAARISSPERAAIARFLVQRSHERLQVRLAGGPVSLRELLAHPEEPLATERWPLPGSGRLVPRVPFEGKEFRGENLAALAGELRGRAWASPAAADALAWMAREALDEAGEIDLSGRRFALLGAGAELAPTPLLLEAGARVLWLDAQPPPESLTKDSALSGELHRAEPVDLLHQAPQVLATITRFAEGEPVNLGLYAYAPGRGREWLLAAAMNAIVDQLDPALVGSVSLLISPAAPAALGPAELRSVRDRRANRPAWQTALELLGVLRGRGTVQADGVAVSDSVVPLQGASYQAAQYVEKILAAETWGVFGTGSGAEPIPVSANVAAITRTRSMQAPMFAAAFEGAPRFGVHTFPPETTRALGGLLLLHDLLQPRTTPQAAEPPPPAERARALFREQVHGGLFGLPYSLDSALQVAAVLGALRRPQLLRGLLQRRRS